MQYPKFPEVCPACGRKFSTLFRPKSRLNKRGQFLFLMSVVVTIVWGIAIFIFFAASPVIVVPKNPAALLLIGAVVFGPGIVVGKFAMNQRSVTLKCRECKWSQAYAMEKYRKQGR